MLFRSVSQSRYEHRAMTKKEFVSMSLPYGLKVVIPESDTKGCRKTLIGTVGAVFDEDEEGFNQVRLL